VQRSCRLSTSEDLELPKRRFWWVQDMWGQRFVVEGGPSKGDIPPCGNLRDWVTLGNVSSRYPADNTLAGTWFNSGVSSRVCDQVTALLYAAKSWPPKPGAIPYNPFGGPNSNSFARYIGEQGLFNPTAPPGSVRWGHSIPTPEGPE